MSDFKYEASKLTEKIQLKIVWALPRWVIRWAVVRAVTHASSNKWSKEFVPGISGTEVLRRWDESSTKDPEDK